MGRRTARERAGQRRDLPEPLAYDTTWAGEARAAVGCAALLLGLLLAIDTGAGTLTDLRAALWLGLAVLLFAVLWPARVSAGRGSLVSRKLISCCEVRTDRLVSVRWSDGVAQRLVLRDAEGNRAEIDPRVLVANPPLWHVLDEDARTSMARGTLCCGETALRQMAARVDGETARHVFKISGLD
ncbi:MULTISPECIES: hypothetical protein [unclassified Streptomyces]|uniref:Uncharacterized protein n=1 Tax=Streptomyces sp. NBC_00060 TaxID=2975636 RepID=A0AAU2H7D6_9ACTN